MCETHSNQVSGAEEPVDLGWLCKLDGFIIIIALDTDSNITILSYVQTNGGNTKALITKKA